MRYAARGHARRPLKVLAVGMDERRLAELTLPPHAEEADLALTPAGAPDQAGARLADGEYDLVLVGWSGCASAAQELIAASSAPTLAVVSGGSPSAVSAALAAGAVDWVPEDASRLEVVHAMRRTFEIHALRCELQALREGSSGEAGRREASRSDLARQTKQLRSLSSHLQSAREDERARAARRIHDDLGQTLTALKMEAVWLRGHIPPDREDLVLKAGGMADLVGHALRTAQTLCTELRPQILDDLGIGPALEWQAEEVARRSGMTCVVELRPENLALDRERSTALFRIFQEALANVVRHAGASRVEASLVCRGGSVALTVKDDGRGLTREQAESPNSFGLLQIRERAAELGGTIDVRGVPSTGTTLTVVLPLESGDSNHG